MSPQSPYADPYNYACNSCVKEVVHRYRYEVHSSVYPYLSSVTWHAQCNNKEYRIEFSFHSSGINYCFIYHAKEITYLIKSFAFLPPLTPTNCDEKLLTYLTFL